MARPRKECQDCPVKAERDALAEALRYALYMDEKAELLPEDFRAKLSMNAASAGVNPKILSRPRKSSSRPTRRGRRSNGEVLCPSHRERRA